MNRGLWQIQEKSLLDDPRTLKKLDLNYRKNKEQDNTLEMDHLSSTFNYEACKNEFWNPENFSLLYDTPLWDQSTPDQKIKLNQLFWVAYYAQIISAEIATIFFNQTCAAGLYSIEDFRIVCDTLDLESLQERAHINAFKKISEDFELAVFGERLFTYPMRTPFVETMIYQNTNRTKSFWKKLQLQAFSLLSSGNAFIACQYFTVRGIRTLNGKQIQHQLSQYYSKHPNKDTSPIPAKVSYHHFLDESFHFNSSTILSHDLVKSLKEPTTFEKHIINRAIKGCQRDHFNFSTAINGIFWFDPALYKIVYRLLRSAIFNMSEWEAKDMMEKCFTQENQGMHKSFKTHQTAVESYKAYVTDMNYLDRPNKEMALMSQNSMERHLRVNKTYLKKFFSSGLAK
jgi:hypothetical protein